MKFTVVGAGAMGLRFGVLLQEAGNEVDFVEGWLPHYNKMKEQGGGYVTREHKNRHLVPVNVYTPEEYNATDADFVFFELKQMQLDDMLKRCEHFLKDQYAMTAMNGMGHVEKLLKYFPEEKVVAGTALVATILTKPGEVEFVGERGMGTTNWANYTEKPDEKTQELMAELKKANFNPSIKDDFMGTLMAKVVFNSVVNTLCTMFEITMGEYAAFDKADELSRQLIDEAYDVCERAGVQLVNTRAEELESVNYVSKVGCPHHYPSMYQDMSHNRPVEVDYINGYFVKLGRQYNYEAKTHNFVTNLVHLAETTRQNRSVK